jgi:hypothetical protein
MPRHAMLNNNAHKNLRVLTDYGVEFGDNQMCTMAIPSEFRQLQAEYPIFFHKNSTTGELLPMAVFGFSQNENLYLSNAGWDASYIPLVSRRGPFMIGFQEVMEAGVVEQRPVISIDLDNPRVSEQQGEPVFLAHGGNSPYLESVVTILQQIHEGQAEIKALVQALTTQGLLEPFTLDVTFDSGQKQQLSGFYTINEEKLAALPGEVLASLSHQGLLLQIYMALASLSNIPRLVYRKNQITKDVQ